MSAQLSISILSDEQPLDTLSLGIAATLPRTAFAIYGGPVHQPATQALTIQDADLDLDHVEPTGVCGCVVEFDTTQQRSRYRTPQHLLEARAEVSVQIIQGQMNLAGGGISAFEQATHKSNEFRLGSPLRDLDDSVLAFRLYCHEHIAGAFAHVLVIVFSRRTALGSLRPGLASVRRTADRNHSPRIS